MMQQVISMGLPPLMLLMFLSSSSLFWLNDNNVAMAKSIQQSTGRRSLVLLQLKDGGISATQRNYDNGVYNDDDDDYADLESSRRQQSVISSRKRKQPKQRSRLKYQNYRQQIKSRNPDEEEDTSTTERPFIRYWNNLVRSVTVPMSNLRLNLTNSLANFFNDGSSNIMETSPLEVNDYPDYQPSEAVTYTGSSSGNKKRRRSHKKKRKTTNEDISSTSRLGDQYSAAAPFYYEQPTAVPYYYYDSNTGKYYGLQPLINNNDYYKQLQYYNYYFPANGQLLQPYDNYNYNHNNDVVMKYPAIKQGDTIPLSEVAEDEEIQDNTIDDDDAMDMENNDDDSNDADFNNNDVYNDNEDDMVAVVDKLDDDEDYEELPQPSQSPEVNNVTNQEQLRNALGSFMRDDRLSRLRQRTPEHNRRSNKNRPFDKQGPRQQKYKYYFLNL